MAWPKGMNDPRLTMNGIRALVAVLLAGACGTAAAHYPWLTVESAPAGAPLPFRIESGDAFPAHGTLEANRVASLAVVGARGTVALEISPQAGRYSLPSSLRADAVLIVGEQQPGYYSRTPAGGKRGTRKEFPDALSCSQSQNTFKALIGDAPAGARALGHRFEIVPLAGAGALKVGSRLPVRLLWQGKPWQGEVTAIHAGYRKREDEGGYPVVLRTDAEGYASVPLDHPGAWMVRAGTREPYPEPATCDEVKYSVSLTFTVR